MFLKKKMNLQQPQQQQQIVDGVNQQEIEEYNRMEEQLSDPINYIKSQPHQEIRFVFQKKIVFFFKT